MQACTTILCKMRRTKKFMPVCDNENLKKEKIGETVLSPGTLGF